jgi:hypothetical protein
MLHYINTMYMSPWWYLDTATALDFPIHVCRSKNDYTSLHCYKIWNNFFLLSKEIVASSLPCFDIFSLNRQGKGDKLRKLWSNKTLAKKLSNDSFNASLHRFMAWSFQWFWCTALPMPFLPHTHYIPTTHSFMIFPTKIFPSPSHDTLPFPKYTHQFSNRHPPFSKYTPTTFLIHTHHFLNTHPPLS